MDWLRRNWPDLAIGVALVAVIAGIIATLLTGGSFFPLAPTTGTTQAASPSALPSGPAAPGVPANPQPTSPSVSVLPPGSQPLAGGEAAAQTDPAAAGSPAEGGEAPAAADAPAPAAGAPTVAAPPIQPQTPSAGAPAPTAPAPVATPPAANPPAASTPAPSAPASTTPAPVASSAPAAAPAGLPAAAADPEAPYRVAVGAFGNADNAARQAATFRDAGYPVFTGTQGALTIVLVGPYTSEAAALQVSERIRGAGFGVEPVVYRFRPDGTNAAVSTPAPAAAPVPAAPTSPTIAAAAPPPAPTATAASPAASAGRYLQVGAYATVESLSPLRDRLAGLGYASTERREDGLIKLLVGPFDDGGLTRARAHLGEHGIDSFVR